MNEVKPNRKINPNFINIIVSVVLLAEGLFLMLAPDTALNLMVIIPAIAFLVYGCLAIVIYAMKKDRSNITGHTYALPIIAVAVGIVLLVFTKQAVILLPLVAGIWLIVCAISIFYNAAEAKKVGKSGLLRSLGIIILAMGIVLFIVGLTSSAESLAVLVGVLFFVYGILSIISMIGAAAANKQIKKNSRVV